MVTSVALATVAPSYWNTGGYPIFLLLLLPITLSCSQLHPFQRCDDFALTMSVMRATIATMVPSSAPAQATAPYPIFFQTHPMPHVAPPLVAVSPVTMVPRRMERRQWDPGILPVARPTPTPQTRPPTKSARRSCQSVPTSRFLLLFLTWLFHPPPSLRPISPAALALTVLLSAHAFGDQVPSVDHPTAWLRRQWDPGIPFHYVHPVLSRPTVPNI